MELFTANCLSTENKPLELSKLVIEDKSSVKKNTESTVTPVNHGTFFTTSLTKIIVLPIFALSYVAS